MTMKKNEIIPLQITGLSSDGNGVGRWENQVVFVPFTVPGDLARVRVVKLQKSHAFGIIEQLVTPAAQRVEPDCPAFGRCGGCSLRQISYAGELDAKRGFVQSAFDRIGGFDLQAGPCLPAPRQARYRNKVQYPFGQAEDGRIFTGFYAPRSHRVIPCRDCLLQPEVMNRLADFFCALFTRMGLSAYSETEGRGLLRHLYLRHAEASGELLACVVINGERLPQEEEIAKEARSAFPQLGSLILNTNRQSTNVILGPKNRVLYGSGVLKDSLCGVPVYLSPSSFYQVNTQGARQLYGVAARMADPQPGQLLLDLYCGAGTIGLSMAGRLGQLVGVEIVPPAVESARRAAAEMGLANARFLCADAGAAARQLAAEGLRPDTVVLDPPRRGAGPETIRAVLEMAPRRVVMVSCNAATAARDARQLAEGGYRLVELQPVDLFPRTRHCELCCLFLRELSSVPSYVKEGKTDEIAF